mmetsp:Transcript_7360/g.17991  ORF Transcript_7360/g.17991 Transcript_7360/m.17991 type:complete len:203 (-) Transcript_7360:1858-2466(-)
MSLRRCLTFRGTRVSTRGCCVTARAATPTLSAQTPRGATRARATRGTWARGRCASRRGGRVPTWWLRRRRRAPRTQSLPTRPLRRHSARARRALCAPATGPPACGRLRRLRARSAASALLGRGRQRACRSAPSAGRTRGRFLAARGLGTACAMQTSIGTTRRARRRARRGGCCRRRRARCTFRKTVQATRRLRTTVQTADTM